MFGRYVENGCCFCGSGGVNEREQFEVRSKASIAYRYDRCLDYVQGKVYARYRFRRD